MWRLLGNRSSLPPMLLKAVWPTCLPVQGLSFCVLPSHKCVTRKCVKYSSRPATAHTFPQKDLAEQARRVRQLEREVAALSGAAAGAGVDVPSILRLAATAASQPDMLLLQAEAAEAVAAAGSAGAGGGQAHTIRGGSGNRPAAEV